MYRSSWICGILFALVSLTAMAQSPRAWVWKGEFPGWFELAGAGRGSFLGVDVTEVNRDRMRSLNLKEERGVEITRVQDDTAAAKAGLKAGDVVLEYNGQPVEGTEQFVRLVRETPPGREVKLLISRGGSTQTLTATMGTRPAPSVLVNPKEDWHVEIPPMPMPEVSGPFGVFPRAALGIEAESLGPQLSAFFGVKEGVLVRSVNSNSPAEKAGIKAGDVITKVDGDAVKSTSDLIRLVRNARSKHTFPLQIMRDKREMTLNVTIDEDSGAGPVSPRPRKVILEQMRL